MSSQDGLVDVAAVLAGVAAASQQGRAVQDERRDALATGEDWARFWSWCEAHGRGGETLPVTPEALADWLAAAIEDLDEAAISATLAAIRHRHVAAGLSAHIEALGAWVPSTDSQIEAMLRDGHSAAATARSLGVDRKRALRLAKRLGIQLGSGRGYRPEVRAGAVAELVSGRPLEEIAAATGINVETLRGWRDEAAVPARPGRDNAKQAALVVLRAGGDVSEAAKAAGVHRETARKWAGEAGVTLARREVVARAQAQVLADIRDGWTAAHAARRAGVADATARAWALRAGIPLPRGARLPLEVRRAVVAAIAGGASVAQAAADHDVNQATVRSWCRQDGVRIPGSKHNPQTKLDALALVAELGTAAAAADRLNIPAATIVDWCTAAGVALEQTSMATRRKRSLEPEAVERLRAGEYASSVSETLGLHRSTVEGLAADHGIQLTRSRPKAIEIIDVDDLDRRIEAVLRRAKGAPSTSRAAASNVRVYRRWCEEREADPLAPGSLARFLMHQAVHGRSGGAEDRGEAKGWTSGTISKAANAVVRWLDEQGVQAADAKAEINRDLEEARRTARAAGRGRRRLQATELAALAAVPPPSPAPAVLLARAALLLEAVNPAPRRGLIRRLCATPLQGVQSTADLVRITLAGHSRPTTLTAAHQPGRLACAHCAVIDLLQAARSVGAATLAGGIEPKRLLRSRQASLGTGHRPCRSRRRPGRPGWRRPRPPLLPPRPSPGPLGLPADSQRAPAHHRLAGQRGVRPGP
jgi:transposase-like protein